VAAAFGCIAVGCSTPPPRPAATSADLGAWTSAPEGAPARSSTTLPSAATEATLVARGPVTLPTHAAPPARPGRRVRVDVSFQQADMVSAFQVLADSGRFNLVMQEGLNGKVSATMRGVDPYDALVALAEANGVNVHFEDGVVVVKRR
jgi:hypothetical protein